MMTLNDRLQSSDDGRPALTIDDASVTYSELREGVDAFARNLLAGRDDLAEERIAMLLPAGHDYVTALLGIWRAGGVAVPLSTAAAVRELEYALKTARATRLVSSGAIADKIRTSCEKLNIEIVAVSDRAGDAAATLPSITPERRAMMLFTSGTTSQPKGVVSTHRNVSAQICALIEAWRWTSDDRIPLFLPLHHIHGIINVLCCALWAGARIDLLDGFDVKTVLGRVAEGRYNVFMAVPTIYVKLIGALEQMPAADRGSVCIGFGDMRLMVSGSAACPVSVHEQWRALTGQTLLERYGMTEIGMALSNPYEGERRPGTVGQPLPGVEVILVDETGARISEENQPGEIRVRGENVFLEYWDNREATEKEFTDDWFHTGDIAERVDDYYRILGRSSVDIIKSGGYKLSALEIESALLDHAAIAECAVVGMPDDTWGEAVNAAVVLKKNATLSADELRAWCKNRMSAYKVPKVIHFMDALPRNAMGKVTKQAVKALL
jgi:malonyl-CoA/methylmalonyl-CoA synthetase